MSEIENGEENGKLRIKNVSLFVVERFRLLIKVKSIFLSYELFFLFQFSF